MDGRTDTSSSQGLSLWTRVHVVPGPVSPGAEPLLRSGLRPHRGIAQDKLPLYLGFFQFVHNARRRGKALLSALIATLVR